MFKELNILRIFFENPLREFGVREAAKLIKLSPATASKKLNELTRQKILKHRKERNLDLFKADIESENYRDLKVYYNLRKIRKSSLINALNNSYLKPTIIFFGSGSQGYDVKESDFDFVVISERTKEFKGKEAFEKKLGRKLQLFIVKGIKELRNKHLINNVIGGIVLQGEIKWI